MKFLVLSILILLLSGCVFWGVSGSFGTDTPDVAIALQFPLMRKGQAKFASQIRKGMGKEEVIRIAGNPHYILDKDDPLYFAQGQTQNNQLQYILEVWYYVTPERFVVYFKDGRVYKIKYLGELEEDSQEDTDVATYL
jgi:hypothetical protein